MEERQQLDLAWRFASRLTFFALPVAAAAAAAAAVCQFLRIISFSSTQLPGPAAHCR